MPGRIEIALKCTLFLTTLCIFSTQILHAQCTNGTQPECTCETAPVLCSVDELDGFVFSMAAFMHPQDGPTPICSDAPSSQTNNPTWFAFTAWCSELTLRARPTNCQEIQNVVGVQIAIYEDCTFENEVACDVDIQDCNTGTKVLAMTGLTIGGVYYFMVDGCLGSYCTVTIDVVGVCGEEEIAPWSMPVIGDTQPCAGVTETYSVESLDGAAMYHWFVDGVLMSQSPSTSFSTVWTAPGSYQLCIDASHDPCVPITDEPMPLCVTIEVHEADAGELFITPSMLCPNDIATLFSSGYTSGPENTQMILITDEAGIIQHVFGGDEGAFTNAFNATFIIYAYNFITAVGTIPIVGMNINDIDCSLECCDLISQSVTFQGVEATVSNIVCNNSETGNDPNDDTFTFDLLVTGQSPGSQWQSTDGLLLGTFGVIRQCGPYLISNGLLNIDIHTFNVQACFTTVNVIPPTACSICDQFVDAGVGSTVDCINTTATLSGSSSTVGTYTWTGPGSFISNLLTPTVIDSGWYFLQGDFANQCTSTDSVYIDMDTGTPVADAGEDQILNCNQLDVFLDGSASLGSNLQYEWINASGMIISTQPNFSISIPGSYTLQLTNELNGCIAMDTVEVMLSSNMPNDLVVDVFPENCVYQSDGVIEVIGISGGIPPFTYLLNGQITSTSGFFSGLVPGEYTLQITDSEGCTLDTFFTVQEGVDLQLELSPYIELIVGHSGDVEASVNVPVDELSSIQWSPPGLMSCDTCLSTLINVLESNSFLLTVIHQNGCVAMADVNVTVVPETEVYIPNIFSPNGDGINDFFTVYANERVDHIVALNVYDRWGELIFQSKQLNANDDEAGWDGTFKGKEMLPSVFVYTVEVMMVDGSTESFSGSLSLVR